MALHGIKWVSSTKYDSHWSLCIWLPWRCLAPWIIRLSPVDWYIFQAKRRKWYLYCIFRIYEYIYIYIYIFICSDVIFSGVFQFTWTVREITKNSCTFSATNISSNMIWFLQLHDAVKMTSNHTGINYDHHNIAIRSHIMIYNSV